MENQSWLKQPALIAHRGDSKRAPENTLAAFRQAISLGVDFFEFDICLSKDGVPVCIHDSTVMRTTDARGDYSVGDLTANALKALDAGTWFDARFASEQIPLFDEVLQLDVGHVGMMIELKLEGGNIANLAAAALDRLHKRRPPTTCIIASFSPEIIRAVIALDPFQAVLGNVEDQHGLEAFLAMGLKHLCLWDKMVDASLMRQLILKEICVWVFTVDQPKRAKALLEMGVMGIITNDPVGLQGSFKKNHAC